MALVPVISAVLVLVSRSADGRFTAVGWLSHPALVWFGGIAYAYYLWHWPLLIFYRHLTGEVTPSLLTGLTIMLISTILAWLTIRYVEVPLRKPATGQRRRSRPAMTTCVMTVAVLAGSLYWNQAVQSRSTRPVYTMPLNAERYPGAAAFESDSPLAVDESALIPDFFQLKHDMASSYDNDCHLPLKEVEPKDCIYGDTSGNMKVVLLGGSHAANWLPTLDELGKDNGWKVISLTKSGCRFLDSATEGVGRHYPECNNWNERVLERIRTIKPDVVITNGTQVRDQGEVIMIGALSRWLKLESSTKSLVLLRDTPYLPMDVPVCLDRYGATSERCNGNRIKLYREINPLVAVEQAHDWIQQVDMTDYFCTEALCPPTAGNIVIYTDSNHFSATYARTLKEPLSRKLLDKLPWLFADAYPQLENGIQ
jgi:hypothetical protein